MSLLKKLLFLFPLLFSFSLFSATTFTWNVDSSGSWSNPSNWNPDTGFPNSDQHTAEFGNILTSSATISLNDTYDVGDLSFSAASQSYTISGGTLNLYKQNTYQIFLHSGTSADQFIASNIALSNGGGYVVAINNNTSSNLTISGVISGNDDAIRIRKGVVIFLGENTYTGQTNIGDNTGGEDGDLRVFAPGGTNIDGPFGLTNVAFNTNGSKLTFTGPGEYSNAIQEFGEDNVAHNANVIIDANSETVVFSGDNSASQSDMTFTSGTLIISDLTNLTNSSRSLIFNGGTLQTTNSFTISHPIILNTDTSGTFDVPVLTDTLSLDNSISGDGSLIKDGAGTLDLRQISNTSTGGTSIIGGIVIIDDADDLGQTPDPPPVSINDATLEIDDSITLTNVFTLNGNSIFDTGVNTVGLGSTVNGSGTLVKTGSGILNMSQSPNPNAYSGGTLINEGTVTISDVNNASNLGSGLVTFNSGRLQINSSFNLSNDIKIDGTATFTPVVGVAVNLSGVISGAGNLILQGTATNSIIELTNANTYSGGTEIILGVIRIYEEGNLGSGLVTFSGSAASNATITATQDGIVEEVDIVVSTGNYGRLSVFGGDTLQWNGAITIESMGTLIKFNPGTLILTGMMSNSAGGDVLVSGGFLIGNTESLAGNITLDGTQLTFRQNFNGTFDGEISEIAAGSVEKRGSGKVTFTNSSSYSGDTTIYNGTLSISSGGQLGTGTRVFAGGTLEATDTFSDAPDYQLNIEGGTLSVIDSSSTFTLSGTISGTGKLIKTGAGTLLLNSGSNTYSGNTDINQGTISVNASNNLGTGSIHFNGGTLNSQGGSVTITQDGVLSTTATIDTDSQLTWEGNISGSGRLIKTGASTLVLDPSIGLNTYSGGISVLEGTLQGTTDGIRGDIFNQSSVNFDQNIVLSNIYSGTISGSGSVEVSGGEVTFAEINTYSGGTTVSNSATLTGTTRSLQGTFTLIDTGILIFDQDFDGTFFGVISGGDSTAFLRKEGSGTTFFNGDHTFPGKTTVNLGTLNLNGSLGGDVVVDSGGTFSGTNQVENLTNDGVVSIGNGGFGEITTNGDYTQGNSGTLFIDIDSLGFHDLLDVTGVATLDGNLDVTLLPGVYSGDQTYNILTAGGGVSGTFTNLYSSVGAPVFASYLPTLSPTLVQIRVAFQGSVTPVPFDALPPNAKSVAKYLFCEGFYPNNSDLLFVMTDLVRLSPREFEKGLEQLSPAIFGAIPIADLENNHLIASTVVDQIEKDRWCRDCHYLPTCLSKEGKTSYFIVPIWQILKQQGYGEQTAFNTRTYGVSLGVSHPFSPFLQMGAGAGYTKTHLGWKENRGEGSWHTIYCTPTLGFCTKNWYLNLLAQGSITHYSIDRRILFPGIDRTAHNHHTSHGLLGRIDSGYKITFVTLEEDPPMSFIPTVRLSYFNLFQKGYRETRADSVNLVVDPKVASFLQTEFLVKFIKEVYFSTYCCSASFQLGWASNIPLSSANYTSRFDVNEIFCEPRFSVQTFDQRVNQISYGMECSVKKIERFQLMLAFEGKAFDRLYVNRVRLLIDWKF